MRVDFPAPFSPSRPSISPRCSVMETSSLARTGPKVLVTPRISRTTGAPSRTPAVPPPVSLSVIPDGPLLDLVWDLDVAVYDPLLRAVHLVFDLLGDLVVEAAERREAYALVVQPELGDLAAGEIVVAGVLYSLKDGVVHPLDHRGQDGGVGEELGLVGVHPDREDALLTRRLEEASAGGARGVVDNVRALVHLLQADLLAARRVVEGPGVRTRVLHEHLAIGAHRLDAGLVAGLELADEVGLLPAQETDDLVVGVGVLGALLRHEPGHHAREVAALLLPEDQARRVLRLDDRVDDGEVGIGVLGCHLVDSVGHEEPYGEDGIVPGVGELGEVVHVVGWGTRLEILGLRVELSLGPLQPGVGGIVEALVAQAPDVEYQRRTHLRCTPPTAAPLVAPPPRAPPPTAGATDRQQRQGQNRRDQDRSHVHKTSYHRGPLLSRTPAGRSVPYRFPIL